MLFEQFGERVLSGAKGCAHRREKIRRHLDRRRLTGATNFPPPRVWRLAPARDRHRKIGPLERLPVHDLKISQPATRCECMPLERIVGAEAGLTKESPRGAGASSRFWSGASIGDARIRLPKRLRADHRRVLDVADEKSPSHAELGLEGADCHGGYAGGWGGSAPNQQLRSRRIVPGLETKRWPQLA
jgi:hypothetical protein